jgi:hypothetical protein
MKTREHLFDCGWEKAKSILMALKTWPRCMSAQVTPQFRTEEERKGFSERTKTIREEQRLTKKKKER